MYIGRLETVCVLVLQRLSTMWCIVEFQYGLAHRFLGNIIFRAIMFLAPARDGETAMGGFDRVPDSVESGVFLPLLWWLVRTAEELGIFYIALSTDSDLA